jgi:fumarylpyruvate hydrolase
MTSYVFTPATVRSLPITDSEKEFAVHRIFCVGRNYAAHAREMGRDPDREPPFFFMKPAAALVVSNPSATIPYPQKTENFHYEAELVVAIGKGGRDIPLERALEHVYGYAVGLDMTRRDIQLQARDQGRPWEFGKSFALSAPIGPIHPVSQIGLIEQANISLQVNGVTKQNSDIDKLIWSVAECIAHLSTFDELTEGDLIMTGTPEGVGAVLPGDVMRGAIDGLGEIIVRVAR